MTRPTQVVVGPFKYSITWVEHKNWHEVEPEHDDANGVTWSDHAKILVRLGNEDGAYNIQVLQSNLLHEILHACAFMSNMNDQSVPKDPDIAWVEEQVVGVVSRPLLGVLRDNPKVLEYLTA